MSAERASLRLRLLWIVLAASLVTVVPLGIALLLQVRDALYARRAADARARLGAVVRLVDASCGPAATEECARRVAGAAGATLLAAPCASRTARAGEELVLCQEAGAGRALSLREPLSPVRDQLRALDARLIATLLLAVALLDALAIWMLERGLVGRLARIDAALEAVGADHEEPGLLPEGGDAVGRVSAAVNRLVRRVAQERERTQAQIAALREARAEVVRSERLASVGRLAAGVAHEVGNPVTALIGYAALMRERLQQGKDVAEYAERIEREATRIDRILRDLLDLARPPPASLESVDLQRAVRLAAASAPLPVDAALDGLPLARGEEHYVVQVLVNLFTNAARAGATRVQVSARTEGAQLAALVADDGKGIAPEALPRLFEPFFTTAAPGQGTGLGLALCHATMERIGGAISARNQASGGAAFELRFALAEPIRR